MLLGRLLATRIWFGHVTALRFAFGLPASAWLVLVVGAPFTTSGSDFVWIAVLAIVTGLVALSLYYPGLKRTPAVIATLAELTFPVTAAIVGYLAFDATLDGSQWLGLALTTTVVALLPIRGCASCGCAATSCCRRRTDYFAVTTLPSGFHWFFDHRWSWPWSSGKWSVALVLTTTPGI